MFGAILVAAIFYRLYVLMMSILSLSKRRSLTIARKTLRHHYLFIFPVYKEQKIIIDTLNYYEQFLKLTDKIQLVFVTTAKEVTEPSTLMMIDNYVRKSSYGARIKVLTCPILDGTKATQINYALHFIGKGKHESNLCLFDCDARISLPDLIRAEDYIEANPHAVIYSFLPRSVMGPGEHFFVYAAGLQHTERMLAFEYASSQLAWKYSYPMGATMIVKPQLWQYIEHIPEPIDDIPLDYLLQFKGLRAKSLPFETLVQAPPDVGNVFRQMIPIFKGVFSYFSTAKRYQVKLTRIQKVQGILQYIFYILEPLGILLALLGNRYLLILLLLQVALNLSWTKKISLRAFIAHLFGYVVRLLQFGYFGWYVLRGKVNWAEFKTERK